jgi:hypothetical protein
MRDDTPFEGVHKARKLDGRRILDAEVDVVVLTVSFQQNCAEIVADLLEAVAQQAMGRLAQNAPFIFADKHQMNMQ